MDCGPTCLAMICKQYGNPYSIQSLRDKAEIGKGGVSLLGISDAAESIGFRSSSVKLTFQQLSQEAKLPAVLHWNQKHFVVLYKAKKNTLYVADPAVGLVTFTPAEFKSCWISDSRTETHDETGVALLLEPTPQFYEQQEEEKTKANELAFSTIFSYLWPYKKIVFQLGLSLGIASIIQLFLPFLTQSIVDTGVNTGNIHFVYVVLLAQLALFTGRMVVEFVRSWLMLHISTRINLSILTDFLIKLMKLPVSFFDSKQTGDIIQRMHDHGRIESFLTGSSLSILFALLNLIVFSGVLAFYNMVIFMVVLIASILYSVWVLVFLKPRKALDYKKFAISSKEQSTMIQLLQGMQEIKLHGCEKPMRWKWEGLQAKSFKLSMKGMALGQWQQAGAFFINEGKNIFITFLSAKAVIDGQMTLGSMLAVQYIIGQITSPVEQMLGFIQSWQNARISMDRLNEIHHLADEEPKDQNFVYQLPFAFTKALAGGRSSDMPVPTGSYDAFPAMQKAQGQHFSKQISTEAYPLSQEEEPVGVTFQNVSFTYAGAGNEPVLKSINLFIPKGKTTAIVGTSGSGKTTLLKLLLKFYDPQKGEIKVGDTALSIISHKVWRHHCGVVMQDSFIFSDTIAYNIAVGEEKVDLARLRYAAHIANIGEFIDSLPLGFNTVIGAEGSGVSMGQRQRILIARAVYKNPDFILLDEATNSLDANNESTIIHNLDHFFKDKTVVVVAHRLSTVKNADQIVVLHKGQIIERGTHQELTNLKGEYYTLVKNQLELGE